MLVERSSPERLAASLNELAARPERARQLGLAAWHHVHRHHHSAMHLEALLDTYRRALEQSDRSR